MNLRLAILFCVFCLLIISCRDDSYLQEASAPKADSIDISEVTVGLPEGEGKEIVERSCVPCHSLRYIEMQPNMPHKAWEKTVTKMIKMYGAPVRDSLEAAAIVDYLTEIKGG